MTKQKAENWKSGNSCRIQVNKTHVINSRTDFQFDFVLYQRELQINILTQ